MSKKYLSFAVLFSLGLQLTPLHAAGKHDKGSLVNDLNAKTGKHHNQSFDQWKKGKTKPKRKQARNDNSTSGRGYGSPALRAVVFLATLGVCLEIAQATGTTDFLCTDDRPCVPRVCNPHPRHLVGEVKKFPPLYQNFPHPGIVAAKTSIKNLNDVQKGLKNIEGDIRKRGLLNTVKTQTEVDQLARPYHHALYKVCEIDSAMGNDDPVDRTNFALGLQRFEETVLKPGFRNRNPKKLVNTFRQIHHTLMTGEMTGESEFRDKPIIIGKGHTRLFMPEEVKKYIAESPTPEEDAEGYLTLIQEIKDHNVPHSERLKRATWEAMAYIILVHNQKHPAYNFLLKHYSVKPKLKKDKINPELSESFEKAQKIAEKDPIDAAAFLQIRLVDMHCFGDGNGRIARLFAFGLLSDYGYTPPVILHNKKYTEAIQQSYAEGNHGPFRDFLREAICETEEKIETPEAQKSWKYFLSDLSTCDVGDCETVCTVNLEELGIKRDLEHLARAK